MFNKILKNKTKGYLGQPYHCPNRQMACVFFVLEIMAPYSRELAGILQRIKCLEITTTKREMIKQDYFLKFIRTTRLKPVKLADLTAGDILLINEYSREKKIDHLGLYLGEGEYLHLQRERNKGDFAEIVNLDDNRHKILGVVRGRID